MIRKILRKTEFYIFLTIIAICILIEIRSGQFFTGNNIIDIMRSMIVPGMFSIVVFMVIVSGGIDVSFPAVASLSMYATTRILVDANYQGPVILPFLMAAGFGLVLGAINGGLIANLNFPTLIVTLGTQSVFRGIMQGVLKSVQIPDIPESMYNFGRSKLIVGVNPDTGMTSNLPTAFLFFLVLIAITFFIMRYTFIGRGIYAIGADESSAERAGFKVKKIKFLIYCYTGLVAGVVGLIRVCLMQQCHPTNLLGTEMIVIAAVALGGTSISGGTGTIIGTVLGIILLITMQNSLLLLGIPTYWQEFFTGLLIIVGVAVSAMQVRRTNKVMGLKLASAGGAKLKNKGLINRIENKMFKDQHVKRLWIILILILVTLTTLKGSLFFSIANFKGMAYQFPEFGLMALGIMLTMIISGIDLSVVGVANTASIVAAKIMLATIPKDEIGLTSTLYVLIAIVSAVTVGMIAGLFNGILISKLRIPPILATLGSMSLFSGIAIVLTEGRPISGMPHAFTQIGSFELFGFIPVSLLVFIIAAIVVSLLLSKTKFGTSIFMLGTNEKASQFSGLNNSRLINRTYMYSGLLASIAGLIMLMNYNSAKADYGVVYTLQCILIVVLGGVNPLGGHGKASGVVLAIIILQLLSSGLNMFSQISSFYRLLLWGVVLLLVMITNYISDKRKQNRIKTQ